MRRENEEGESVGRFLTKTTVYIQARLVGKCQDSCKIFQTWCPHFGSHIRRLTPFWKHRAAWLHSLRCAGMRQLTLCLCWKHPWTHTCLCRCLAQMCFIWTLGPVAWINLLLQHKQRAKPKMGGIRRGCTPRPDQSIHTNTAQSFRELPDGDYGNFRGKKKYKYHFASWVCTFKFAFGRAADLISLKCST